MKVSILVRKDSISYLFQNPKSTSDIVRRRFTPVEVREICIVGKDVPDEGTAREVSLGARGFQEEETPNPRLPVVGSAKELPHLEVQGIEVHVPFHRYRDSVGRSGGLIAYTGTNPVAVLKRLRTSAQEVSGDNPPWHQANANMGIMPRADPNREVYERGRWKGLSIENDVSDIYHLIVPDDGEKYRSALCVNPVHVGYQDVL